MFYYLLWIFHLIYLKQYYQVNFLEIFYDENDKVVDFKYKKINLTNSISLSKLDEESIADDRRTFEVLKNILSNLRTKTEN